MRPMVLFPLIILLAVAVALGACNGDGEGTDTDTTRPTATTDEGDAGDNGTADEGDSDAGDGGGGPSAATLTIGDETWTFDRVSCAFSPEESRNERVSFTAGAFTESSQGVRLQLDVTIQDPEEQGRYEGDGVIHSLSLEDVEDFENPSLGWSSRTGFFGMGERFIQINGKTITANTAFDDTRTEGEIEEVPGSLEATCP